MNQTIQYEYKQQNYNASQLQFKSVQKNIQEKQSLEITKMADNFVHFCATLAAIDRRITK
jgi:hypothetical protein